MLKTIRPAIVMIVLMTGLTGIAYPFAVTGIAQAIFPSKASGSLIERDGKIVGSQLIAQGFAAPRYFQSRPSATADATKTTATPYNAQNSMGSNAGPTAKTLVDRVQGGVADYRAANGGGQGSVPADAVTTSGSGLDPHITPENAEAQIARVATARALSPQKVRELVNAAVEDRTFGFLGEPRVNVLLLNLSLDREQSGAQPGTVARQ